MGDVNRAELASKAKREFLDAQSLDVNDDAMDTLEAGGDSLAPELTGDLYEDLQNMKTVADVNKVRAYYNQMCDARVSELKSKKRSRQSGEAEEDNAEELEGGSAELTKLLGPQRAAQERAGGKEGGNKGAAGPAELRCAG